MKDDSGPAQPNSKVVKLSAGDGLAAISNYCVALCYDVLRREGVDMTLQEQPPITDD